MKHKNISKVEINKLASSSILKFKKKKCILEMKKKLKRLVKFPSQSWEITDSVQPHITAKYKEEIEGVPVLKPNNGTRRPEKLNTPHVLKTGVEQCESDSSAKVSIVQMSSGNIVNNVLKKQCSDKKHNKTAVTYLKSLMSIVHKDTSSSIEANCLSLNNSTKCTVLSENPDEVHSLMFSGKQSSNEKVTTIDNEKGHLKRLPNQYFLAVNSQNIRTTTAEIYELTGFRFLLVVKPECFFYFVGIVELELLKGSIEILGYTFNRQKQKLLIFSTQGSSHVCIKASKYSDKFVQNSQKLSFEQLLSLGLSEEKSTRVLKDAESCTLIIMSRSRTHVSSSVWPKFFENHHSFSIFPPDDILTDEARPCHDIERQVECIFDINLNRIGLKQFVEVPEWSVAIKDITCNDCPRTILCGGKSVGKSTLLRYLINKCLYKWDSVLVLDFDLGQCEFTIGGCISVVLVTNPVLGPNYTHLKQPLRSVFLGEIDVTKCPENYIEGYKSLIEFAKQKHNTVPWLINTMGFTKGFGIMLTCGIIKDVNPTHVIEIQSIKRNLNFPSSLHPRFVHSQNVGAFGTITDYKLFTVQSGAEQKGNNSSKARGMSPAEARNLVVLSYFSEMLSPKISSLTQVTPYMINMNQINLQITNKYNFTKAQLCATMNGNLVALCILTEGDKFPHCPGFGIVRGIDEQTGTIYLITPLPKDILGKVNCLVKGNIALPESLYLNQGKEVVGLVPYLAHTSGQSTSRFAKRDFRTLPVTQKDSSKTSLGYNNC